MSDLILSETKLAKKTAQDLRNLLWEELDKLVTGQSSPAKANSVSRLACQILDSVRLEIQNRWAQLGITDGQLTQVAHVAGSQKPVDDPSGE